MKLQVGDTPGVPISLVAIGFAVLGLCLSLFVRPRRIWVRVRSGEDGRSVVEVGGLDRADARAGLTEDVAELADELARPDVRRVRRRACVNYEYYSSLALVSSVVVYALAMFAHAAEWAAARTGRRPATRASSAGSRRRGRPSRSQRRLPLDAGSEPAQARRRADRLRVEQFGRIGVALTVLGFVLSVAGVVLRGLAAGRAPWGNMFEFTITAMVFVVGVYLVLVWRAGMRWLGLPVTLLAASATVSR